jgi:hypothetical protein
MRRIARTGKSSNNDEIQGSFTPFRMTAETLGMTAENKEQQKALSD